MTVTIRQALQHVSDNPVMLDDVILTKPVHELVCRTLFDIANNPQANVRGSLKRANTARSMIFNRMVGRRRPGSHPATRTNNEVTFKDLTKGEIQ